MAESVWAVLPFTGWWTPHTDVIISRNIIPSLKVLVCVLAFCYFTVYKHFIYLDAVFASWFCLLLMFFFACITSTFLIEFIWCKVWGFFCVFFWRNSGSGDRPVCSGHAGEQLWCDRSTLLSRFEFGSLVESEGAQLLWAKLDGPGRLVTDISLESYCISNWTPYSLKNNKKSAFHPICLGGHVFVQRTNSSRLQDWLKLLCGQAYEHQSYGPLVSF